MWKKVLNGRTLSGVVFIVLSISDLWLGRLERLNFLYSDLPKVLQDMMARAYEILAYPPPFLRIVLISIGLVAVWRGMYFQKHPSSPLEIEFSGDVGPYFEEIIVGNQTIQTFRVRLKNRKHHSCIGRVTLYLKSIDPQPNALYATPIPLHFARDMKPPFDTWCLLQEGGSELVDVVSYKVLTLRDNFWTPPIHIEHTCQGESQEVPGNATYYVVLEAVGYRVKAATKRFRIFVENGNLRMVPESTRLLDWLASKRRI